MLGRAVCLLVVFAGAFALSRGIIDAVFELRPSGSHANDVFHKLAVAEQRLGGYDVIYVGSSRSRRAFRPDVFERELRRRGIELRAFNLGLPGLEAFGQDYVVRRLLANGPIEGRPRLLIVAPDELGVALDAASARSDRQALWHSPGRTARAVRATLAADAGALERIGWSWNHVTAFLLNASVSGRIANRVNHSVSENAKRVLGPRGDGYVPHPVRSEGLAGRIEGAKEVETSEKPPPPRPTSSEREWLESLTAFARSRGVEIVFVREPVLFGERSRFLRWYAENGAPAPVVDLGNPRAHPELFDPELFFDVGHLNDRGASLFTRALAREIAARRLIAS